MRVREGWSREHAHRRKEREEVRSQAASGKRVLEVEEGRTGTTAGQVNDKEVEGRRDAACWRGSWVG